MRCRRWLRTLVIKVSYLLRQLKYPDTDKDRILALLEGVHGCWVDS